MKLLPFEKRVFSHLKEICPDPGNKNFLLAVSGGVDSMALLQFFVRLGFNLEVAHCNFCLRGKESDLDEALVKTFCKTHSIVFHSKRFEQLKDQSKGNSIQQLARELRYEWFNQLLCEKGFDNLVLAHHANDNFETSLYQFIKGTGLKGLKGIPEVNNKIIRPLLKIKKSDIIKYSRDLEIPFRDDSSNDSNKYNRNLLRLEVLPILKKINPDLVNTFKSHSQLYIDAQEIIEAESEQFRIAYCKTIDQNLIIDFKTLKEKPGRLNILLLILEPLGFTLEQLISIFRKEGFTSGKKLLSKTHKLIFNRGELLITPLQTENEEYVISKIPFKVQTKAGELNIEYSDNNNLIINELNTIYLKHNLTLPVIIRSWKQGDSFQPSGMNGKSQKLKDYFINNKFSIPEKHQQLLLTSNNEICWIIGKRADERFIESNPGKKGIKVTWKPYI